ncbi:MAG: tetratricopeptide repeat protein [Phycisphaerae bacterium]|nr:tetratricopeptide repeat protein [Phycisphaerae bacterium]
MRGRHFNWKIAIVLLLGFGIIAGIVAGLHNIQKSGRYENYYSQGIESFEQRQWQEAAEYLGKYIAHDNQNTEVLHKYAQAQLNIKPSKPGNIKQAIGAFRDILRIESGDRVAAKNLVEIYLQTRAIGEAHLVAQRFLKNRRDADVERLLAEAMIFQREYLEAYKTLQSVIEEEPNQIMAYERLAALTVERPDDFKLPAKHWLDLAIQNNPESALAYLARARFNLMQKEKAHAIQDLEAASTKMLSDPEEHMAAAVLYRALGQMDLVEEQLDAIQSLQPDYLPMWIFRTGIALTLPAQDSQKSQKMRQLADDSLANLDENKWGFYTLATELYVRAEVFDKAEACLAIVKEQESDPAEVAYLEGLLAAQQDRIQEAAEKWKRALALGYQGPSPYVRRYLGFKPVSLKVLLASAQEQLGDIMSARQLLNSLASDNADDLSVQIALARHMAQSGDWAQAKSHTQNILRRDPNNTEASLLNLEAEIRLLALEGPSVTPNQWQSLEQRMGQLSVSPEEAVSLSLLRFQMALSRHEYDTAKAILGQLKPNDPVNQQKVTVAWINLLLDQNRSDEIIAQLKAAVKQHDQSEQMVRLLAYFVAKEGDHDAAEQVLRDAMARINAPSSNLRLGYMLSGLLASWAKGENDPLKEVLDKKNQTLLNELDQTYPDTITVQRQLFQCQLTQWDKEKKKEGPLLRLSQASPDDSEVQKQLVECQTVIDHAVGQAQALVNKIRTLEGEEGWQWRYEQARLWFAFAQDEFQKKYSEAVSLLQQNLRSNGNNQLSRRLLAAIHSKAGQSSQALATYRDALNREPDNLSIVIPAVKAMQEAKEYDQADDLLKRVASRNLTDPSLDKLQVYSYIQQGEVGSAAALMESYLQEDPNNVGIALALAGLKAGQKEYGVAKAMLDKIKETTQDASTMFKAEQLEVQILMQQGLPEQALQLCNDLVDTYKDAESLKLRYNINVTLGQMDSALEDLNKAIEYQQDDADLWVKKSSLYWSLQRKVEAMKAMDKAIMLTPGDPNVVVQAVNLLVATQEPDQIQTAKALLEQASQQHPDDYRFKIQRVRFMLMEGNAASQIQAESMLEQLTMEYPKEASVWLTLGDLLMGHQDWAKALNIAMRGLTEIKDNFALLSLKANAEIQISPRFAVQTLEAMLEQSPTNVLVALQLASAHIKAKNPEKAIEVLSAHKELCTRETEIKLYEFTLVSALLDAGQQTEADMLLAQLKQKYPDDQRIVIVQIPHWIREGNYEAVDQAVMQWLEANPGKTGPVEYAARVLRGLGQAKTMAVAEHLLSAAMEKQPESEALLMISAQTYQMQGRVEEAAQLYEKALLVNPNNVVAMNNVAWIYGHDLNQIDKAMEWAQKGLVLAPQYTDLLDTYGTICYMAAQYDKAIKSLKECLNRPSYRSADSTATTMYTLAKSYQAIGDRSNARLMFKQCLDRNRQLESGGLSTDEQRDADKQLASLLGN